MVKRFAGRIGLFALMFGFAFSSVAPGHIVAQEATPGATPVAEETVEETAEIVTLVAWYQADEENDLLVLVPLETSPAGIASGGDADGAALTGSVDFEAERNAGGLPRITLGDSIFDAYPLVEGDRNSVQQWLFFQGNDSGRPATLVMQVTADAGPYEGAVGTATFISRSLDSTGVVVIVLYLND
jgi:hypothetical protein